VLVTFYQGEPKTSLIGAAKIAAIQPQARENASVVWTPPKTPGDYRVYVTLEPATGTKPTPSAFTPSRGYRVWTVPSA
jgi:hypothetical protein